MKLSLVSLSAASLALLLAASAQASLIHQYTFNDGTANDSVGSANGTLIPNTLANPLATISGGQLNLNNPNFSGPSSQSNYLSLPPSILPSSGSATIEQWFTFTGSGFFTEAFTFTNNANDTNPPSATNGQYLMGTISFPDNGTGGGSHIGQATAGYTTETDAIETTGFGVNGLGYLDNGQTFMMTAVIDGNAGTLSYFLNGVLQQTIPAVQLSSYGFTNAYLGRSAFPGDNATSGSVDEFRVYDDAQSAAQIAADFAAGPAPVPEPAALALVTLGALGLLLRRRKA